MSKAGFSPMAGRDPHACMIRRFRNLAGSPLFVHNGRKITTAGIGRGFCFLLSFVHNDRLSSLPICATDPVQNLSFRPSPIQKSTAADRRILAYPPSAGRRNSPIRLPGVRMFAWPDKTSHSSGSSAARCRSRACTKQRLAVIRETFRT